MKSHNYKTNLKIFRMNSLIFILLLLIVSIKMVNTAQVHTQYKQGKAAYDREDYLATEKIYTELYGKKSFTYFTNEIRRALKTDAIVFIKQGNVFLEDIKDNFKSEVENNEIAAMVEIHNQFNAKLTEVQQSLNEENIKIYNTLIENSKLTSLFSSEFERVVKVFEEELNQSIESESFESPIDFILYSLVLEKTILDSEEKKATVEQEIKRYYVAKLDWLIKEDNLEDLLSETQQVTSEYGNLMEVEWMIDRATQFTSKKMKDSIENKNYAGYRILGSRYFTYLSQLPSQLSNRDEIKQLVSGQLESDFKKTQSYIAKNKFEEAKLLYDAIEEYIVIVDNVAMDMGQLKQDIETVWMKNDPIRMFEPLVLTEIAKGKSKWGRDAYILATDASNETLYWGEIDSQQVIKKLEVDISAYDVQGIFISQDLSTKTNPVLIVEEKNNYGGPIYNGFRVEENGIVKILTMEADYFEVKKQGEVLLAYDSSQTSVSYYELMSGDYINVFTLEDIKIVNTSGFSNIISGPKSAYSLYEIDAISVFANMHKGYNNNNRLTGALGINYKDPFGSVMYHSQSDGNYTWSVPLNTFDVQSVTQGLRTDYALGTHQVEFWWDGIKIAESQFTVTE
ncbi:MAG TPA: hypothetical protein GX707_00445 [Epulopiscium sp.]|nr:hypothetical protein [Candidatus Epulonipiscium sp.]